MMREVIDDFLYDTFNLTTTTTADLFTVPLAQTGNGITGKTRTHTNMVLQGVLPNNESFKVLGVGIYVTPLLTGDANGTTNTAFFRKSTGGYVKLTVGNKTYYQWNMRLLLQARMKVGHALTGVASYFYESPHYAAKGFIPVTAPFVIRPGVSFKASVVLNEAPGSSNPYYVAFVMLGIRNRGVQ